MVQISDGQILSQAQREVTPAGWPAGPRRRRRSPWRARAHRSRRHTGGRTYQRAAALDRLLYPKLGGSTADIGPCGFWPGTVFEPPVQVGGRGPSTMLLVQNERDPGTSLVGA
ncbi:alpha/beta hydrolase [Streptomyces sp. NPDC002911]